MTPATDARTALSDRAVATLRTAVPALWGTLVTVLLGALAGHLPDDVHTALAGVLGSDVVLAAIVAVVIAAWYAGWRRLEPHVPLWLVRLVLGSARTPSYAPVAPAVADADRHHLVLLSRDLATSDPARAALERVLAS